MRTISPGMSGVDTPARCRSWGLPVQTGGGPGCRGGGVEVVVIIVRPGTAPNSAQATQVLS